MVLKRTILPLCLLVLVSSARIADAQTLSPEQKQAIDAALASVTASATPARPRVVLVSNLQIRDGKPWQGHSFSHVVAQNYAIEELGRRTGAYSVVFSNDVEMFRPDRIRQFDAIIFNNTVGVLTEDAELRESLLGFIAGGKGFVGIHDAIATFVQHPVYDQWPEFGQMLGGTENGGHPWNMHEMTIKVDDPDHPINAVYAGRSFMLVEQAFQLQEPTFRDRLRVLLAIDPVPHPPVRRIFRARQQDMDFPMVWIKPHGRGRVYFNGFGHTADVFTDARMLQHILAGIQYAIGDLKADDTPSGLVKR
jgi:type 1 glutamine amidotransferase